MIRTAFTIGRIPMAWHDNFSLHLFGACNCRVEVIDLKPQQYSVSVWLTILIAYRTMMVRHIPFV